MPYMPVKIFVLKAEPSYAVLKGDPRRYLPGGSLMHFSVNVSVTLRISGFLSGMTNGLSGASILAGYVIFAGSIFVAAIHFFPLRSNTVPVTDNIRLG